MRSTRTLQGMTLQGSDARMGGAAVRTTDGTVDEDPLDDTRATVDGGDVWICIYMILYCVNTLG